MYQASFTGLISFPLHYNPLKGPFGSLVSLEDWETKGSQMLRVFFFKQIEGNSCDSFYCSGLESNLQYLWGMPITSLGQDKPICSLTCQLWGSAGKESAYNVGDLGSIPALGRSSGEGNGYSSMDSIVHEVSKSWPQLSDFHMLTMASPLYHTASCWCPLRGQEVLKLLKSGPLDEIWGFVVRKRVTLGQPHNSRTSKNEKAHQTFPLIFMQFMCYTLT